MSDKGQMLAALNDTIDRLEGAQAAAASVEEALDEALRRHVAGFGAGSDAGADEQTANLIGACMQPLEDLRTAIGAALTEATERVGAHS